MFALGDCLDDLLVMVVVVRSNRNHFDLRILEYFVGFAYNLKMRIFLLEEGAFFLIKVAERCDITAWVAEVARNVGFAYSKPDNACFEARHTMSRLLSATKERRMSRISSRVYAQCGRAIRETIAENRAISSGVSTDS